MCAHPKCGQRLAEELPDAATGERVRIIIGQEAHIRSWTVGGPRYDPHYPADKLHSYENFILLCPTHHTEIDARNGAAFSAENLLETKSKHEAKVRQRTRLDAAVKAYLSDRYRADDGVRFEQVDLDGPTVDSLFVDVPIAVGPSSRVAELVSAIVEGAPGDQEDVPDSSGVVVAGGAQTLLNPAWQANALIVGGPGQGKSTLLQYVCQFHRSRLLEREGMYTGEQQRLTQLTSKLRIPIRVELREYAMWAKAQIKPPKKGPQLGVAEQPWPSLEGYLAAQISTHSGDAAFAVRDLLALLETDPGLLALDGLDEVASLHDREEVSRQIVATENRLSDISCDVVVLVATRPGATSSAVWSSRAFPTLQVRRLTQGLRLQYLQRWAVVAGLDADVTSGLQRDFLSGQHMPHIRELSSYPMQLAILLHLLQRRQFLPQQRTELYAEYVKTFFDREQVRKKELLLSSDRKIIEDIHAYLGWHMQSTAESGGSSGSLTRDQLLALLRTHLAGRDGGVELAAKLFTAFTERVLCLVERDGAYQFEVQSLREYFAARYVWDEAPGRGQGNTLDDRVTALLQRPYWNNVLRFLVGMLSKGEVRSLHDNLSDLMRGPFREHPYLRSMAVLLLEDRCFEGQSDAPIQVIVDFVLSGPGVTLGEDGLLDPVGSPLRFSERAGRQQAISHLKGRLACGDGDDDWDSLATSLRRHLDEGVEDVREWWWSNFVESDRWLGVATHLGVLRNIPPGRVSDLEDVLSTQRDTAWGSEFLQRGGYLGASQSVYRVILDDLNDGAVEVLNTGGSASVDRILQAARYTMLTASVPRATDTHRRRRRRQTEGLQTELEGVAQSITALRSQPDATREWGTALQRLHQVFGDGWVIRQTIQALPRALALPEVVEGVAAKSADLAALLNTEASLRTSRGDAAVWSAALPSDRSLARESWLVGLLSTAHMGVICALANDVDAIVAAMTPRRYRATSLALQRRPRARDINLSEQLRLNQVSLAGPTLWLLRPVSTDATRQHIDRRLIVDRALLKPAQVDLPELDGSAGCQEDCSVATQGLPCHGQAGGLARRSQPRQAFAALGERDPDRAQRLASGASARSLGQSLTTNRIERSPSLRGPQRRMVHLTARQIPKTWCRKSFAAVALMQRTHSAPVGACEGVSREETCCRGYGRRRMRRPLPTATSPLPTGFPRPPQASRHQKPRPSGTPLTSLPTTRLSSPTNFI